MAVSTEQVTELDLGCVVAQLALPSIDSPLRDLRPFEYAPIGRDFGGLVATHFFSPGVVVAYTMERDGSRSFVTESTRICAEAAPETLFKCGVVNLERGIRSLSFHDRDGLLEIGGHGSLTASLVLIDALWESERFVERFPNGPAVAIGAVDSLYVCDQASPYRVRRLRRVAAEAFRISGPERALTPNVLVRDRSSRVWSVLNDSATEPSTTLAPFVGPVGGDGRAHVQDRSIAEVRSPSVGTLARNALALTDAIVVGEEIPMSLVQAVRDEALANLEHDSR